MSNMKLAVVVAGLLLLGTPIFVLCTEPHESQSFLVSQCLGLGRFSSVYSANMNGTWVALKIPHPGTTWHFHYELTALRVLREWLATHPQASSYFSLPLPNFPEIFQVQIPLNLQARLRYRPDNFWEPTPPIPDKQPSFAFPLHIGNLNSFISGEKPKFSVRHMELDMAAIAIDIALALQALESASLVHQNIKPQNILLKPNLHDGFAFRAILADFGSLAKSGVRSYCASDRGYQAPELPCGPIHRSSSITMPAVGDATALDVFSFGSVLLQLWLGRVMDQEELENYQDIFWRLKKSFLATAQHPLASLVRRCWSSWPKKRPRPAEILDELIKYRDSLAPFNP